MNKKVIRLTENDLHKIVKESVKRILKEDIYGKVGKRSSTFDTDNIPYDDDYIEKYGATSPYASNIDNDDVDDDYPYERTNQSINRDAVAFLHRIESAVEAKFGGRCDITYSMDKNEIDREQGNWSWTDIEDTDKVSFHWYSGFGSDPKNYEGHGNDVFQFVLKFIKMKNMDGIKISNVETSKFDCSLVFDLETRTNDFGRNNKINISNKHGKPFKHTGSYRYGSENLTDTKII